MIDTIRLKVPINYEIFGKIRALGVETVRTDNTTKEEKFHFINHSPCVGSYSRSIFVYPSNFSTLFLELSVPKYLLQHNVYLLSVPQVYSALQNLSQELNHIYNIQLPKLGRWTIQRLDVCYMWKYPTQEKALQALRVIQRCEVPKKLRSVYQSSVFWKGGEASQKFYLKYPEFVCHDYDKIRESDITYADCLKEHTKGILRFEVTLKKKWFDNHYKRDFYLKELTDSLVYTILQENIYKITNGMDMKYMSQEDTCNYLQQQLGKRSGTTLFLFYQNFIKLSDNELQALYSYPTIQRKKQLLKQLNVSRNAYSIIPELDFSIPSKLQVQPIKGDSRQAVNLSFKQLSGYVTPA